MRLWDLSEWIWNQKGRPAGWNLKAGATCCLEAEFLPPQVLLLRSSTEWPRPPQCWGWPPVSSDDGCDPHPQNTFTGTSELVFCWITGDWYGQTDSENWPPQYLLSFYPLKNPLKNPDMYINTVFAVHWDLHWKVLYVQCKISEAWWWCVYMTDSRNKQCLLEILKCSMPSPDLWSSGV